MIKIGKYYYKNFWAFIQVIVFSRPNLSMPKDWNPKPFNPMENWTIQDFIDWDRYQYMIGDR